MQKEEFVKEFRDVIIEWTKLHEKQILNYKSYSWKGETYEKSVRARNKLEEAIKLSRQKNNGGIDLATADKIYRWGFGRDFPIREEKEVLTATREAFQFLDEGDCYQACKRLMSLRGVGVAGATKILGLSDQEKLCIYDSRVGHALRDLRKHGEKVVLCPPDRSYKRDSDSVPYNKADHVWAENYQKLVWALEIIQGYFRRKGHHLRIADIEMGLFMMGEI